MHFSFQTDRIDEYYTLGRTYADAFEKRHSRGKGLQAKACQGEAPLCTSGEAKRFGF